MNYRYPKKEQMWDKTLSTWREAVGDIHTGGKILPYYVRKKIEGIICGVIDDCVGFSYSGQWWTAGKGKAHFHKLDRDEVLDIVKDEKNEKNSH